DDSLMDAVWYARQIAGVRFDAIHVSGKHSDPGLRPRFRQFTEMHPDLKIVAPENGRTDAGIEYVWALPRGESSFVTVVVPELFRNRSLLSAVHRDEFSLKLKLLREPGVVITNVPVVAQPGEHRPPKRLACRVLVSGAHAASLRALRYAETLGLDDTRAVCFAFDAEEAERMRGEWAERDIGVPLEIEEAHFRDIGDPLLAHVRRITDDPEAAAAVIMPELIFSGLARTLHNQRAL